VQRSAVTTWGLEVEASHWVSGAPLGAVVQIGPREFLAITQKGFARFEPSRVIEVYPFRLMACVSARELGVVMAITAVSPEFWVFPVADLRHPVRTGIKVGDPSVFSMTFCPRSGVLVTFGESVRFWDLSCTPRPNEAFVSPRIHVSFRNVVIQRTSGILNPPVFEAKRERLVLDDGRGNIERFGLDGAQIDTLMRLNCAEVIIGFHEPSMKFLTADAEQGLTLWAEFGTVAKRFPARGIGAVLAIRFLDSEHALLLDARGNLTILDVKTSKAFVAYTFRACVSRLFVFEEPFLRVVACTDTEVTLLWAFLPWRLWAPTFAAPVAIQRCPKPGEAARVAVLLENSHLALLTPVNGHRLTAVTLKVRSEVAAFHYDRGSAALPQLKRDVVLMALRSGEMQTYSTGADPCAEVSMVSEGITALVAVGSGCDSAFYFGTSAGHLLVYDYVKSTPTVRWVIRSLPILRLWLDANSDSLLVVFADRVVRWSLTRGRACEYLTIQGSALGMTLNDGFVLAGANGKIRALRIDNGAIALHELHDRKLHEGAITAFSQGPTFFATSSRDATLRVWLNDFSLLHELKFPVPLNCCVILNGRGDILVGTDTEIMIVEGHTVFDGEVDPEDATLDNYDRLRDDLGDRHLIFGSGRDARPGEQSVMSGRTSAQDKVKTAKVRFRGAKFAQWLMKCRADHELAMRDSALVVITEADGKARGRERVFQEMAGLRTPAPGGALPVVQERKRPRAAKQAEEEDYYDESGEEDAAESDAAGGEGAGGGVSAPESDGGEALEIAETERARVAKDSLRQASHTDVEVKGDTRPRHGGKAVAARRPPGRWWKGKAAVGPERGENESASVDAAAERTARQGAGPKPDIDLEGSGGEAEPEAIEGNGASDKAGVMRRAGEGDANGRQSRGKGESDRSGKRARGKGEGDASGKGWRREGEGDPSGKRARGEGESDPSGERARGRSESDASGKGWRGEGDPSGKRARGRGEGDPSRERARGKSEDDASGKGWRGEGESDPSGERARSSNPDSFA